MIGAVEGTTANRAFSMAVAAPGRGRVLLRPCAVPASDAVRRPNRLCRPGSAHVPARRRRDDRLRSGARCWLPCLLDGAARPDRRDRGVQRWLDLRVWAGHRQPKRAAGRVRHPACVGVLLCLVPVLPPPATDGPASPLVHRRPPTRAVGYRPLRHWDSQRAGPVSSRPLKSPGARQQTKRPAPRMRSRSLSRWGEMSSSYVSVGSHPWTQNTLCLVFAPCEPSDRTVSLTCQPWLGWGV